MRNRFSRFGNLRRAQRKSERIRIFMRWFSYSVVLLLFYMIMAGGFFRGWQPIMIIPLAIAVSMRERELSASVFGAVCGLIIDIACGKLFGFSGVWLLPGCLAAALLVSHLIKVNLINFIWVNAIVCTFMATTDYFFRYFLWGADNSSYILTRFTIPSHLSAVILSPVVYFIIKHIDRKYSPEEQVKITRSAKDDEEEYKL